MEGRARAGVALAALLAMGLAAPSALAARTTITFNESQLQFGGGPGPNSTLNQGQPVRMVADIAETGYFVVAKEDFDFPPVTGQVAPGQQANLDLIPEAEISGEYRPASGELKIDYFTFTLHADLSGGGSCEIRGIPLFLSTATSEPFAGNLFDPGSVPPVNGAIAGSWDDLPASDGGLECPVFDQFASGEGGVRLANDAETSEGGELSVSVNRKRIVFGDEVTIKGRLSGVPSGSGGHAVELIQLPYPYDEPAERRPSDITSEDGTYSFKVRPQFNTRYLVRDTGGSGAESSTVSVWVWEKGDFDLRVFHGSRVKASWTLRFGESLETDFTKRPMLWYFKKKGERTLTLKDKTRISQKPGRIHSKATFGIPNRGRYRFYVYPCFDEPRGDDGTGKPEFFRCPRKEHSTPADFR